MDDFFDRACRRNVSSAFLWTPERNMPARRFYADAGFVETGERKPEPGTKEYILKYEMDFADTAGKI